MSSSEVDFALLLALVGMTMTVVDYLAALYLYDSPLKLMMISVMISKCIMVFLPYRQKGA